MKSQIAVPNILVVMLKGGLLTIMLIASAGAGAEFDAMHGRPTSMPPLLAAQSSLNLKGLNSAPYYMSRRLDESPPAAPTSSDPGTPSYPAQQANGSLQEKLDGLLMVLVGAAMIVLQLRRKHKVLPHRPLLPARAIDESRELPGTHLTNTTALIPSAR